MCQLEREKEYLNLKNANSVYFTEKDRFFYECNFCEHMTKVFCSKKFRNWNFSTCVFVMIHLAFVPCYTSLIYPLLSFVNGMQFILHLTYAQIFNFVIARLVGIGRFILRFITRFYYGNFSTINSGNSFFDDL